MTRINSIGTNGNLGIFGRGTFRIREPITDTGVIPSNLNSTLQTPSYSTLSKIIRLRESLESLKPSYARSTSLRSSSIIPPGVALAISESEIDFGSQAPTQLQSIEEINTAPTSFTAFGPNLVGSTLTAPWAGDSTAAANVSGTYDGSNGSGELTFRVSRDGTHGEDDLRIDVFDPQESRIDRIDIDKNDPLNKVYDLSNGLSITLGAGDLVDNDEFIVDTSLINTSYTPAQPEWTGSTVAPTIGGEYDGSHGTGTLTFRAMNSGIHGDNDLKINVYAPDDTFIEQINVRKNHAIDRVYELNNGLSVTLSAGELIEDESFTVDVDSSDPDATTPGQPEWLTGTATATIGGTYDGTNGTGTITFDARDSGTHGEDDLDFRVYAPDGSLLQTLTVDKDDPLDQVYTLNNGLTFSLSAGDAIKNETFTVDVQSTTSFSTEPNPVESTAEVTIGGVYDGDQQTGDLSFQITAGGTHGVDDLAVEIYGPDDVLIDTVNVSSTDSLNHVYQISNGLTFQLGSGTLVTGESFDVSVNHEIGSRVDPDKPFDGTRNDNPNLDIGLSITNGSFDINGVTIDVFANDTINTVLTRINGSSADVAASFDSAEETILLTRNTPGLDETITLANDTSGFLVATKLAGATPTNNGANLSTPIGQIDSFSIVSSGSFTINGEAISLDVDSDSITDIIDRINGSDAGVTASFDSVENRFSIVANQIEDLVVDSGDTGLFEAMAITSSTYLPTPGQTGSTRSSGLSSGRRRKISEALDDVSRAFNSLFRDHPGVLADPALRQMRTEVQQIVSDGLKRSDVNGNLGLKFNFSVGPDDAFRFNDQAKIQLNSQLRSRSGALTFRELMFGEKHKTQDGLAEQLIALTREGEKHIANQLGAAGVFVDVFV